MAKNQNITLKLLRSTGNSTDNLKSELTCRFTNLASEIFESKIESQIADNILNRLININNFADQELSIIAEDINISISNLPQGNDQCLQALRLVFEFVEDSVKFVGDSLQMFNCCITSDQD